MLIESLGLFCIVGIILTAVNVYKTPLVKNVEPYTMRQRHVIIMSKLFFPILALI